MKTCIKIFILLCLVLAVYKLSASDSPRKYNTHLEKQNFSETFVPIIDLLQDGESYQIEIVSIGCFNGTKQSFSIFREIDTYFVNFRNTVKKLGTAEINAVRNFENSLQTLAPGGCSTVDTYELIYGASRFQTSDGTCSFHGGRNLMRELGILPNK